MMAIRTNFLQRNGISGVAALNRVRVGGRNLNMMTSSVLFRSYVAPSSTVLS